MKIPPKHDSNSAQQHAGKEQLKDYDTQIRAATKQKKDEKSDDVKDRSDSNPRSKKKSL